jgi:hypothetical protein
MRAAPAIALLLAGCIHSGTYRATIDHQSAGCCSMTCSSSSTQARVALTLERGGAATLHIERRGWQSSSSGDGPSEVAVGSKPSGQHDERSLDIHKTHRGRWHTTGRSIAVDADPWHLTCRAQTGRRAMIACKVEDSVDTLGLVACGPQGDHALFLARGGVTVRERAFGLQACGPTTFE